MSENIIGIFNRIILSLVAMVLIFNVVASSSLVYATSDDKQISQLWLQFQENSDVNIPIAILYEGEKIKLLDDGYLRLESDGKTVDFMIDNFTGTYNKAWDAALYSCSHMHQSEYIHNYKKDIKTIAGKRVLILSFERDELKYAPNLYTNFVYVNIEVKNKILASIQFKSREKINIEDCMAKIMDMSVKSDYANLLKNNGKAGGGKSNRKQKIQCSAIENINTTPSSIFVNQPNDIAHKETSKIYLEEFMNKDSKFKWGIFEPMSSVSFKFTEDIEKNSSMHFDILLEYYHMNVMPVKEHLIDIYKHGKIPELTFQTSILGDFRKDMIYDILSGKEDEQIDELLEVIQESDVPILFRLNNEMNGDWCNYNALYYHQDPDVFVQFWKMMKNRCDERSINNLIWVWNPNWGDFPSLKWNNYMRYFPDPEYVDIIGLTGYNTGTYYEFETWREFKDIYNPMIDEYNYHFEEYPYIITEFGCSDTGGDKPKWIKDALNSIERMPIRAAVWWNGADRDPANGKVARKYRFDDETETLAVFREYMEEENK